MSDLAVKYLDNITRFTFYPTNIPENAESIYTENARDFTVEVSFGGKFWRVSAAGCCYDAQGNLVEESRGLRFPPENCHLTLDEALSFAPGLPDTLEVMGRTYTQILEWMATRSGSSRTF